MKYAKTILVTLSAVILAVMFGCAAMMDLATPSHIEPDSITYSLEEARSWLPWTTLWDSYRIDKRMDYVHQLKQTSYARLAEDDNMEYGFLKQANIVDIQGAKEFQRAVFTPEGPIGLLFPTLFGGTLGALLIPRLSEKEKDKELIAIKNGTT